MITSNVMATEVGEDYPKLFVSAPRGREQEPFEFQPPTSVDDPRTQAIISLVEATSKANNGGRKDRTEAQANAARAAAELKRLKRAQKHLMNAKNAKS